MPVQVKEWVSCTKVMKMEMKIKKDYLGFLRHKHRVGAWEGLSGLAALLV